MGNAYYVSDNEGLVSRRSNWSVLKTTVLEALVRLDDTGEPERYSDDLSVGYFGVTAVARELYGEWVFTNGKLDRNRRSWLNRVLNAMCHDGFVDKSGKHYNGVENADLRVSFRDFSKCFWCITPLGKRASEMPKRVLIQWMSENRFYTFRGIKVNRSHVKRTAEIPWD